MTLDPKHFPPDQMTAEEMELAHEHRKAHDKFLEHHAGLLSAQKVLGAALRRESTLAIKERRVGIDDAERAELLDIRAKLQSMCDEVQAHHARCHASRHAMHVTHARLYPTMHRIHGDQAITPHQLASVMESL